MQVSLNTAVFLPQLERSKSQLACLLAVDAWPIDNIEVRGEFFAPATKVRELEQIAKLCQKNDWELYYSVPEELFLGDERSSGGVGVRETWRYDQCGGRGIGRGVRKGAGREGS